MDLVIDTHFHGDHTGGNGVFKAAGAKTIVAHAKVPELMKSRANPNGPPPTLPDATFPDTWRQDLGDEVVSAKFYGPAHTGGDIVVLFEKANVVHMGDLVFNRRQPFIDRPGGASIQGWITLLEQVAKAHGNDTIFVFGHAGERLQGHRRQGRPAVQRDYLTALLDFTRKAKQAGQTREAFIKTVDPAARLRRPRSAHRAGHRRGLGRTAVGRRRATSCESRVAAALAASIALGGAAAAQAPNHLSPADQKAGWTLLFNGTSLDGWRAYKRPDASGTRWVVKDGLLCLDPGDSTDTRGARDIVATNAVLRSSSSPGTGACRPAATAG